MGSGQSPKFSYSSEPAINDALYARVRPSHALPAPPQAPLSPSWSLQVPPAWQPPTAPHPPLLIPPPTSARTATPPTAYRARPSMCVPTAAVDSTYWPPTHHAWTHVQQATMPTRESTPMLALSVLTPAPNAVVRPAAVPAPPMAPMNPIWMEPAASQAVCVQQPPFPTPPLMCVLLATLPAPHVPSALITALAASIHSITYQMCATPTAQLGTTRTPAISSALSAIPSALHATYPALAAQPAPPTVRINHSCRALHASLLPPVPLAPTPNTLRMSALPAIHHVQPAPSLSITALAVLLPCSICLTSATPTAPLAIMRIQATASVHSAMSSALPVRFLALTARPAQPMAPMNPI